MNTRINRRKMQCPYNKEVYCQISSKNCQNCGWNPQIAWDRLSNFDIFPDYKSLPTFGYQDGEVVYIYRDCTLYPYTMIDEVWCPLPYD